MKSVLLLIALLWFFTAFSQKPELVIPTGHTGRVNLLQFSYDGKFLLSSFGSSEVILWNLSRKKITQTYHLPARVTSASINSAQSFLSASATDGSVFYRSYLNQTRHQFLYPSRQAINDLVVTGDGELLYSCHNDSTIRIIQTSDLKELAVIPTGDPMEVIAINHGENLLICGDRSGKILILNLETRQIEFRNKICEGAINEITVHPDDSEMVMADSKGKIYVVSLDPVRIRFSFQAFSRQAFSASIYRNYIITTGRDDQKNLKFFRLADGTEEKIIPNYREELSSPNFIYGIYTHAVSTDGLLAIPWYDGSIRFWNLKSGMEEPGLDGLTYSLHSIEPDGHGRVYYTSDDQVGFFDLAESRNVLLAEQPGIPLLSSSLAGLELAVLSADTLISIYNDTGQEMKRIHTGAEAFSAPVGLTEAHLLISRKDREGILLHDLNSGKSKKLNISNCIDFRILPAGNLGYFLSNREAIVLVDLPKKKVYKKIPQENLKAFDIDPSGKWMAGLYQENYKQVIRVSRLNDFNIINSLTIPDSIQADRIYFGGDETQVLTISRSVGKFNQKEDLSIRVWDMKSKTLTARLTGHNAFITDIEKLNHTHIISSSLDGTIRIWSLTTGKELASIIPMKKGDWVALNPEGSFDASSSAMKNMHFSFFNEEIQLNQLKDEFYEPKLIQKTLHYSDETFITGRKSNTYTLYPEIRLMPPDFNDGVLGVSMEDKGGGIGRIAVLINGKEAIEDAREILAYDHSGKKFDYPLTDHPYLKPGTLNKITVRAYNNEGYLIHNEKSIYLLSSVNTPTDETPDLYSIIIGISDYTGDEIDLTFSAKDAEDFAHAITLASEKYLGKEKVHIYRMTSFSSDSLYQPVKRNIERVFREIGTLAKPKDILMVYLSGHGMDNAGDGEFYYLTADCSGRTIHDPEVLSRSAISSQELTRLIKQVPALKQLMIIDACHSGNILVGMALEKAELSSENIRVLEKVKDRTGMYILASSEGEDVSYESSVFEQGLLTYSLLFGLKGAALKDGELVDVVNLLQYAGHAVPVLARDIGKRQQPVIKIPDHISTFNIGKLSIREKDRIEIKSPKPIVIRSSFQNDATFIDDLQVSQKFDNQLKELRGLTDSHFIFLDEGYFNNAWAVYGRYSTVKDQVKINYRIYKNTSEISNQSITSRSLEEAVQSIAQSVLVLLKTSENR